MLRTVYFDLTSFSETWVYDLKSHFGLFQYLCCNGNCFCLSPFYGNFRNLLLKTNRLGYLVLVLIGNCALCCIVFNFVCHEVLKIESLKLSNRFYEAFDLWRERFWFHDFDLESFLHLVLICDQFLGEFAHHCMLPSKPQSAVLAVAAVFLILINY